jgi:hypothetical protein
MENAPSLSACVNLLFEVDLVERSECLRLNARSGRTVPFEFSQGWK